MKDTYHHGDLREALITEAERQVIEGGLDHVSLRAVAQAVGVSPSAAYHHFADKEALLAEVCRRCLAELNAAMGEALAGIHGYDAQTSRVRLMTAAEVYIDFALGSPNKFRAAFSPHSQSAARNLTPVDSPYPHLASLFDDLVTSGAIDSVTKSDGLAVVWSTVHGIATLVLEGHLAREDVAAYLDAMGTMLGMDS